VDDIVANFENEVNTVAREDAGLSHARKEEIRVAIQKKATKELIDRISVGKGGTHEARLLIERVGIGEALKGIKELRAAEERQAMTN
jgi:hypothetical protein